MRLTAAVALAVVVLAACGDLDRVTPGYTTVPFPTASATPSAAPKSLDEIVRSGRIRVGFNMHQIALVRWDGSTPGGVHWDLAEAMARDLGVVVDWSLHYGYVDIFSAGRRHEWDVAFAVVDPTQPAMAFSNPYLENEWAYLVPAGSLVRRPADADRPGHRIAMFGGTEFERYLAGALAHATIVTTRSTPAAIELVKSSDADVAAGSRNELGALVDMLQGGRLLDEPVTKLRWSVAVAGGRSDVLRFVSDWVERAKASGLVQDAIARARVRGMTVSPPGP